MKFLVVFVLALYTVSAFDLRASLKEYPNDIKVPVLEGRITNGKPAKDGQFPYQVGLTLKITQVQASWCGGSLISANWVLTAAHCTENVIGVTVYLGAVIRLSGTSISVGSQNVVIHPGWQRSTLLNDISLIKLSTSVVFNANIQKIALPAISNFYSDYVNEWAVASGWGRTSDLTSSVAPMLQYENFQVISNTQCRQVYGSVIDSTKICIGTRNGISTCNGDSGGPLALLSNKMQVGLVSFGAAAGCQKGYPIAFTRVTSFLDWIIKYTGPLN